MWKWINRAALALIILVLAIKLADGLSRRAHALPFVPQPNGYELLLEAGRCAAFPGKELGDLDNEAIQELAQKNKPVLFKVREALAMRSAVPLDSGKDWMETHEQDLKRLKRLAILFAVESKSSMLAGRTNQAAKCNFDVIQLGQTLARGGILLDGISGITIETVGTASLQAAIPLLSSSDCKDTVLALQHLESRRSTSEQIIDNEKVWAGRRYGVISFIGGVAFGQSLKTRYKEFDRRYCEVIRRTRRLQLRLAARAYELESGKPATNASELVPRYLTALPSDPVTGVSMDELPPVLNSPNS